MKIDPIEDLKAAEHERLTRNNPKEIMVARSEFGHIIICSVDDTPVGQVFHVSVEHPDRMTTQEELLAIRDECYPGTSDTMIVLPRTSKHKQIPNRRFDLWTMPWDWDRF